MAQWHRYAFARLAAPDECGLRALQASFRDADGNVAALIRSLVAHDEFLTIRQEVR